MRLISIRDRISFRSATVIATATNVTLTLSLNIASTASRVTLLEIPMLNMHLLILFRKYFHKDLPYCFF